MNKEYVYKTIAKLDLTIKELEFFINHAIDLKSRLKDHSNIDYTLNEEYEEIKNRDKFLKEEIEVFFEAFKKDTEV